MKTHVVILAVAFTAILMISNTAQARRWVYSPAASARVYASPRVALRPVGPVFVPVTSTVVTPDVVIGPRGRLHYVTPISPIGTGPYIGW